MDLDYDKYLKARLKEAEALDIPDSYKGRQMNRMMSAERVLSWTAEAESYHLVYTPVLPTLKMKAFYACPCNHVNKGEFLQDIWVCHDYYGCVPIPAPAEGVWSPVVSDGCTLQPDDKILFLNTRPDVIMQWKKDREKERLDQIQKEEEREKAAIAAKLIARQRKRLLEQQVRLELIDSGELFGGQQRRPAIPRDVVDAVYRRDGGRCVYCGATENLQLDHIIPFSKGGATSIENLQLLCQKCNLEKSNKIG
jgi:5-methylcytosine-specific restriction endonuclease McrA